MSDDKGMIKRPRYNLVIPPDLNRELQRLSQEHNMPVPDLIRHFIKLGLVEDSNGPFSYEDENGKRVEIELYPENKNDQKLRLWKNKDGQ